jgi:predicted ATPase
VKGDHAIAALLAGSQRKMNQKPKERLRNLPTIVADWLVRMRLIDSFELRPIAKGRKEYEVILRTTGARAEVKLTDVGFGLSQVLPVIVESFYVKPNSTVVFEQPEIHLHPSVQADLADLFIEAIDTRESGQSRSIQFIVESHSEHFLRRLQRRIAEGAVAPEAVAMYFCEPGKAGATVRRLEIDKFGRIANWPKDFFGDIIGDVAAQTRSAIESMRAASHG